MTPSSITVQWGPVDCIHRNGDITGYTVRVRASGEAERTVSVDESVNETTMCGLTPFTEYTVSVAAENNVDIGVYSNMITMLKLKLSLLSYIAVEYLPPSIVISKSILLGLL